MAKGIASPPPKAKPNQGKKNAQKGNKSKKVQQLGGLTKGQNKAINQRQDADIALGGAANQMLPGVQDAYSQPFDWNSLPQQPGQLDWEGMPEAPGMNDYTGWVGSQMQNYNNAFDERNNPIFAQQSEQFEQQMANRGIPMGSELYNKEKSRLEQSQSDQRTQAYAENQGQAVNSAMSMFGAGQQNRNRAVGEGMTEFDVGNQVYNNSLSRRMGERNLPLQEFNQMYGSVSGMPLQNLGYSQAQGLQQQDFRNNMKLTAAAKAGMGGGGGGGDGSSAPYGFPTIQDYWAAQDARNRGNLEYEYQLKDKYAPQQPKGPSYTSQVGGSILGAIGQGLSGWAGGGFKW